MKVVVGIEDQIFGNAIVEFIGTQKWAPGTEFRLLYVVDTVGTGEVVGELCCPTAVSLIEEQKKFGQELLMELDLKLLHGVPDAQTEQKVAYGRPKEKLLDEVEEWKADLLIVGSHGRTGFSRFLLGSVSMALLSAAPCSVLIVKIPPEKRKAAEAQLQAAVAK